VVAAAVVAEGNLAAVAEGNLAAVAEGNLAVVAEGNLAVAEGNLAVVAVDTLAAVVEVDSRLPVLLLLGGRMLEVHHHQRVAVVGIAAAVAVAVHIVAAVAVAVHIAAVVVAGRRLPSVFGRNLQCEQVRKVDNREECH
jgi:hypothetical protein